MKVYCRDVISKECEWELIGVTPNEVIDRTKQHSLNMHNYHLTPEDEQKIRGAIRS